MRFEQIQFLENDLSAARAAVLGFTVEQDETLATVVVKNGGAVAGDSVFKLQKNGADILSGDDLKITTGNSRKKLEGQTLALAENDELTLDFVSGSVVAPITLILGFAESAAGDASSISGVPVADLATVAGFADDFEGASVNAAKWKNSDNSGFAAGRWTQSGGKMKQNNVDGASPVLLSVPAFTWVDGSEIVFHIDELQYNNQARVGLRHYDGSGVAKEENSFQMFFQTYSTLRAVQYDNTGGYVSQIGIADSYSVGSADEFSQWKFLKLERNGNNLLYSTSPTGASGSWVLRRTEPSPAINGSTVHVFAESFQEKLAILEIYSNFGAAGLNDFDLLRYKASTGKFEKITLVELKAALAAIP